MTREERIQAIADILMDYDDTEYWSMASAVLDWIDTTAPAWIRTADRLPVESDGLTICIGENENGELIEQVGWSFAKKQTQKMRDDFSQKGYVYWMPLPPLPEVEG